MCNGLLQCSYINPTVQTAERQLLLRLYQNICCQLILKRSGKADSLDAAPRTFFMTESRRRRYVDDASHESQFLGDVIMMLSGCNGHDVRIRRIQKLADRRAFLSTAGTSQIADRFVAERQWPFWPNSGLIVLNRSSAIAASDALIDGIFC